MSKHEHGTMDVTDQEKTFAGFMRFWVWVFGLTLVVLILLAIFRT